jgi:hypothetical protein
VKKTRKIRFDTTIYEYTYDKGPGGFGTWGFSIKGAADGHARTFWYSGPYGFAKQAARAVAKKIDANEIEVLT